jgi:hypothetical protein
LRQHQIFEGEGITVCAYIRNQRLLMSDAMLRDPNCRKSISEIAYQWGFGDQTLFSRNQRSRFGCISLRSSAIARSVMMSLPHTFPSTTATSAEPVKCLKVTCSARCSTAAKATCSRVRLTKANFVNLRYIHAGTNAPGRQMVEQWLAETESSGKSPFGSGTFPWHRISCGIRFPESVARRPDNTKAFRLPPLPLDPPPIEIKVHTYPSALRQRHGHWLAA